MKLKAIQQICKGAKRIELYTTPGARAQWISDGGAIYPLYNLPELKDDSVYTLFDIPESKRDKIRLEHRSRLPANLDFADYHEGESLIEQGKIEVCVRGRTLIPLTTSLGAVYINAKYLTPFSDSEAGVQFYERHTASGGVYLAVKEGFLLTGIILPYDVVTTEFIKELEQLHRMTALAESNRQTLRSVTDFEQSEIEDLDE